MKHRLARKRPKRTRVKKPLPIPAPIPETMYAVRDSGPITLMVGDVLSFNAADLPMIQVKLEEAHGDIATFRAKKMVKVT